MKWLVRLMARFGHVRLSPEERSRNAKERRVLREADRVIADYRRMDGALRITIEPKR